MQGRIALLTVQTPPSKVIRSEGWIGCMAAVMRINTEFLFNDDELMREETRLLQQVLL